MIARSSYKREAFCSPRSICTEYWARAVPIRNAVTTGIAASAGNAKPKPSPKIFILACCCLLDGRTREEITYFSVLLPPFVLRLQCCAAISRAISSFIFASAATSARDLACHRNPPMLNSNDGPQARHCPPAQGVHAARLASKGPGSGPDTAVQNLVRRVCTRGRRPGTERNDLGDRRSTRAPCRPDRPFERIR